MNYQAIIDRYYPDDNELRHILMVHSQSVTARALRIVDAHPELRLDRRFVEEAAMLHDIGIFRCHAPSIACHGTEPYICHGRIGAELLRAEGCERHARVCERPQQRIDRIDMPLGRGRKKDHSFASHCALHFPCLRAVTAAGYK